MVANATLTAKVTSTEKESSETFGLLKRVEADLDTARKESKSQRRTLMALEFERAYRENNAPKTLGKLRCPHCPETYQKEESLASHIRKRHAAPAPETIAPAEQRTIAQPTTSPSNFGHANQELAFMSSQIADLRSQLQFERERQLKLLNQPPPLQSPPVVADLAAMLSAASRFTPPSPSHSHQVVSVPPEGRLDQIESTLKSLVSKLDSRSDVQPTKLADAQPIQPLSARNDAPSLLLAGEANAAAARPPPKFSSKKPWQRIPSEVSKPADAIVRSVQSPSDSFDTLTPPVNLSVIVAPSVTATPAAPPTPIAVAVASNPAPTAELVIEAQPKSIDVSPPMAPAVPAMPSEAATKEMPGSNLSRAPSGPSALSIVSSQNVQPAAPSNEVSARGAAPLLRVSSDVKLAVSHQSTPSLAPLAAPNVLPSAQPPQPNVRILSDSSVASQSLERKPSMPPLAPAPASLPAPAPPVVEVQPISATPTAAAVVSVAPIARRDSTLTEVLDVSLHPTPQASSLPPGFEFAPTVLSVVTPRSAKNISSNDSSSTSSSLTSRRSTRSSSFSSSTSSSETSSSYQSRRRQSRKYRSYSSTSSSSYDSRRRRSRR